MVVLKRTPDILELVKEVKIIIIGVFNGSFLSNLVKVFLNFFKRGHLKKLENVFLNSS